MWFDVIGWGVFVLNGIALVLNGIGCVRNARLCKKLKEYIARYAELEHLD